ncbi:alpha-(1-2)-mannopyranosyltransferase MptD [Corynebacterium glutamicum]|uniref:alpha-(1-2)-mannopyranosyltransferase MptD n=1 Tax=Corynebacterium glutamicum TaxID=1718 RepID=UPI0014684BBB|nr:alpha-(1-2)-mannopyranosyltransferase MptD [Corynebacterium glutamicum]GFK19461.1 membrane protein [Corynebacterium glutamicum]
MTNPQTAHAAASDSASQKEAPNPSRSITVGIKDLLGLLSVLGIAAGLIANKILIERYNWRIDAAVYREGALALVNGESLYAQPFDMGDISLPFIYPPIGAILFAPWGYFDFITVELAGNLVVIGSSLLLLLCLYLVTNAVLSGRDKLLAFTIAAISWPIALFAEPVFLNADLGQINILIMALVVMDLLPIKRRIPRGVLIGLAAAIKITPLAMLLYFLVKKDFRGIINAVISLLAFTAIGAVLAWENTKEFFSSTLLNLSAEGDSGVDTTFQSNSSIQAMLYRWWTSKADAEASSLPTILWIVLSLIAVAAVAYLMHQLFSRGLHVEAVMVNAMLMLLISPISWSHHWVWLPLWAVVFFVRYRQHRSHPKFLLWSGVILSVMLLMLPPKWWFGRDGVNVFELNFWEKLLISDWTWLSIGLMITLGLGLKAFPKIAK